MARKTPGNQGSVILRHGKVCQTAENFLGYFAEAAVRRRRNRQKQREPVAALPGRLLPGETGAVRRLPVHPVLQVHGVAVDLHRAHGRRDCPGRTILP